MNANDTDKPTTPQGHTRAAEMLRVASTFIRKHAAEFTAFYDDAYCDGYCIADDCDIAADMLDYQPIDDMLEALRAFDPWRIGSGQSTDMSALHDAQMKARAAIAKAEGRR